MKNEPTMIYPSLSHLPKARYTAKASPFIWRHVREQNYSLGFRKLDEGHAHPSPAVLLAGMDTVLVLEPVPFMVRPRGMLGEDPFEDADQVAQWFGHWVTDPRAFTAYMLAMHEDIPPRAPRGWGAQRERQLLNTQLQVVREGTVWRVWIEGETIGPKHSLPEEAMRWADALVPMAAPAPLQAAADGLHDALRTAVRDGAPDRVRIAEYFAASAAEHLDTLRRFGVDDITETRLLRALMKWGWISLLPVDAAGVQRYAATVPMSLH